MNFNLAPAEYQEVQIDDKKKRSKNKTIKQRRNTNTKVNRLIRNITANQEDSDDEDERMGDFIPKPDMTSLGNKEEHHKQFQNSLKEKQKEFEDRNIETDEDEDDQSVSKETFKNIPKKSPIEEYYNNNAYHQYLQNEHTPILSKHTNEILSDKLNYMIHLLEEQKDEKAGTLHEELILYGFLGIFIIFLVDSFARVGKYYTR